MANEKHYKPNIPSLSEIAGEDEATGARVITGETSDVTVDDNDMPVVTIRGYSYTAQDCIDDLKAVSEAFPDKRITRDFYRQQGQCPEAAWTGHFGNFPEFLKQSGLEHTRHANKIRNQVARHAAVDELREVSAKRAELGAVYERDDPTGRFKTMVACSDLHDERCDPFYLRVLCETIKDVNPDVVCLDGDIFDVPEFGKYGVDPREWDVVGRIRSGLDIIRQIREAAPEAQIDFIEGNHEARVIRHLLECSPAMKHVLSGLHGFDLTKLFKLDEYEVNYVANADLFTFTDAQTRKEMSKNHKPYWGCVLAHHFPHGREHGMPGFSGHNHKHLVWSEHNATYGSYEWHQMGAGHIREASFCDGTKWNNGFLVVMADTTTRDVVFDYCSIGSTFALAAGRMYARQPDEFYPALVKELDLRKENR
jgi:hypothetical protein